MTGQFAALDKAYGTHGFLAGSSLSAADLLLAPILAYVNAMPQGGVVMAQYPNVVRAHQGICQRSSFKTTQPG